jgi:hypothetical protein
MRNYITVYVTYWKVSATPAEGWGFGASQTQARGVATSCATIYGGGLPDILTDLPRNYFPLSRQIIAAAFALSQLSPKDGLWNELLALENHFDLQPGVSPLKQGAYPYKPKKVVNFTGKNVLGKQSMDLQTYLFYLENSWRNGIVSLVDDVVITTFAPQRWLEWIVALRQKVIDTKITPTQVYAALALVDFSGKPPII